MIPSSLIPAHLLAQAPQVGELHRHQGQLEDGPPALLRALLRPRLATQQRRVLRVATTAQREPRVVDQPARGWRGPGTPRQCVNGKADQWVTTLGRFGL